MADKTLTVILQTRDEMSKGLADISKSLDKLSGSLTKSNEQAKKTSRAWKLLNKDVVSFKQVAKGLTASAAIIAGVGTAIAAMALKGEEVLALRSSFKALTAGIGENADEMLTAMQVATSGLVSNSELIVKANNAILLGLPVTTESMAEMSEAAVVLGRAMGLDATNALNSMITGLGRQSKLLLDNLGIMVNVEDGNKKYADVLGITVEQLTDADRKQAFYNETMAISREMVNELGGVTLGFGGQIAQARASIVNFKDDLFVFTSVMGDQLLPVFTKVLGLTDDFGKAIQFSAEVATSFTKNVLSFLIDGFVLVAGTVTNLLDLFNILQFVIGQIAGGFVRLGEVLLASFIEPMQFALEGARLLARSLGLLKFARSIQNVSTSLQGVQDGLENARKTTVDWANQGLKDITSNRVALDKMSNSAAELRAGIQNIQAPDIVEAMNGAANATGAMAENVEEITEELGKTRNLSKEILAEFEKAAKLDFQPFDRAKIEKQVKMFSEVLGAAEINLQLLTDEDLQRLRDRMKSLSTDFGDNMLAALTSGDATAAVLAIGEEFSEDLGDSLADLDIAGFSVGGILKAITSLSKDLPKLLFQSIKALLVNVVQELPLLIGNIVPDLIIPLLKLIPKVINGFAQNLAPMIDALIMAWPDLMIALLEAFIQLNPAIFLFNIIDGAMNQWMGQSWPGIKQRFIMTAAEMAIRFIRETEKLPETLIPALLATWTAVSAEIANWWQRTIWNDLTVGLGEVLSDLAEQFNEMFIQPIAEVITTLFDAGSEIATQITTAISDGATDFGTQMAGFATDAAMLLVQPFLDMIEQLKAVASDIGDALSLPEVEKGAKGLIEQTTGISFQRGTTFVPFTGPAVLHRGEAVIPAEQNPFAGGATGGGGMGDMNFNITITMSGDASADGANVVEAFVSAIEDNVRASGDRIRNIVNRSGI